MMARDCGFKAELGTAAAPYRKGKKDFPNGSVLNGVNVGSQTTH